jgi:Ethanolamine utilization protein EutJ (predicted chaperonin)
VALAHRSGSARRRRSAAPTVAAASSIDSPPLFLGVDFGTSGARVTVVDGASVVGRGGTTTNQ